MSEPRGLPEAGLFAFANKMVPPSSGAQWQSMAVPEAGSGQSLDAASSDCPPFLPAPRGRGGHLWLSQPRSWAPGRPSGAVFRQQKSVRPLVVLSPFGFPLRVGLKLPQTPEAAPPRSPGAGPTTEAPGRAPVLDSRPGLPSPPRQRGTGKKAAQPLRSRPVRRSAKRGSRDVPPSRLSAGPRRAAPPQPPAGAAGTQARPAGGGAAPAA